MKKILLILSMFQFVANAQIVNKFRDSTWFKSGVQFDGNVVFKSGAGSGKVWTSNSNGTGSWQTISSSGVSQGALNDSITAVRNIRKVDTIYKNLDSIIYKINGIRYSVLDSTGGGVQTLSISGDTLSISGGNSVVLPVYVQVDSATVTSYDVLNSQNAPPVSPSTGDTYLVGNSPSGAWVGHAKDIAEWNGSAWVFTDGVQGDFLYNATTALTYIFRSGNWVQTTGIPILNNGNTISSGLTIGTNNARSLNFETNNINRGRFDSTGRFYVYNIPTASDTFLATVNSLGVINKIGKNSIVDTFVLSTKGNVTGLLLNKQDNLISGTNIKTVNSTSLLGSGNITTPDAQTLSTSYGSDSITLSISGGNSIKFAYAVDSVGMVSTDSLITYKAGVRRSYKVGSTGGGGALSAITAATATNTIDNTNYKQRWSWNTLAGDTALALNSSSTAAASNLNTLLAVTQTGANANASQTTFGIKVSNIKTGISAINIGVYSECSGSAGSISNIAIYAKGVDAPIVMDNYSSTGSNYLQYRQNGTEQAYVGFNKVYSNNVFEIMNKAARAITIGTNNSNWLFLGSASGNPSLGIGGQSTYPLFVSGTPVSGRIAVFQDGFIENNYAGDVAFTHSRAGSYGTIGVNSSGNFIIGINGAGTGTQIAIHATRDNVGMGTVTPVASAKLELSSTTQGLLISRGTTTNRDAISSPATLLQFGNTTSNTIDTYDGTRWTNGAKFLTNTATLDFGNTSAQTSADLTITVTGAADGDAVIIGVPNGSVNANSSYSAWVSSANTVTIRFNNYSSGSIDPASGIFKATVNK